VAFSEPNQVLQKRQTTQFERLRKLGLKRKFLKIRQLRAQRSRGIYEKLAKVLGRRTRAIPTAQEYRLAKAAFQLLPSTSTPISLLQRLRFFTSYFLKFQAANSACSLVSHFTSLKAMFKRMNHLRSTFSGASCRRNHRNLFVWRENCEANDRRAPNSHSSFR